MHVFFTVLALGCSMHASWKAEMWSVVFKPKLKVGFGSTVRYQNCDIFLAFSDCFYITQSYIYNKVIRIIFKIITYCHAVMLWRELINYTQLPCDFLFLKLIVHSLSQFIDVSDLYNIVIAYMCFRQFYWNYRRKWSIMWHVLKVIFIYLE